jgi:hypothetical protein
VACGLWQDIYISKHPVRVGPSGTLTQEVMPPIFIAAFGYREVKCGKAARPSQVKICAHDVILRAFHFPYPAEPGRQVDAALANQCLPADARIFTTAKAWFNVLARFKEFAAI